MRDTDERGGAKERMKSGKEEMGTQETVLVEDVISIHHETLYFNPL